MAYETGYAQCRRGAPGTSAAGRALWPVVQDFDWCLAYLPDLPTQTLLQAEGTGGGSDFH